MQGIAKMINPTNTEINYFQLFTYIISFINLLAKRNHVAKLKKVGKYHM